MCSGTTQFYLPLTRLSTNGINHPDFTPLAFTRLRYPSEVADIQLQWRRNIDRKTGYTLHSVVHVYYGSHIKWFSHLNSQNIRLFLTCINKNQEKLPSTSFPQNLSTTVYGFGQMWQQIQMQKIYVWLPSKTASSQHFPCLTPIHMCHWSTDWSIDQWPKHKVSWGFLASLLRVPFSALTLLLGWQPTCKKPGPLIPRCPK